MLDDLYKTAIVFINDTYVDGPDSTAAGEVARELFSAMRAKGWHDARLIDGTGKPLNEENRPNAGFEAAAMKRIRQRRSVCIGARRFVIVARDNDRVAGRRMDFRLEADGGKLLCRRQARLDRQGEGAARL